MAARKYFLDVSRHTYEFTVVEAACIEAMKAQAWQSQHVESCWVHNPAKEPLLAFGRGKNSLLYESSQSSPLYTDHVSKTIWAAQIGREVFFFFF